LPSFSVTDLLNAATLSSSHTRIDFLSAAKLISTNSSLPVDERINLLSEALLRTQIPDSPESNALKEDINLTRQGLINLHGKLTVDIEGLCARFLLGKLYPLQRAPFNYGYRTDFYFEILNALNRWIESDVTLNKEAQLRAKEVKLCLERMHKLFIQSSQELISDDSTESTASGSLIQFITASLDSLIGEKSIEPAPLSFETRFLAFLNETKDAQEFWLPLTCLNPFNSQHQHVIILRFHKIKDETSPLDPIWKVSLVNIGLGAVQSSSERNVCYDIEAQVAQSSINISALNLLNSTFESPQKLYETIQKNVFNSTFKLGKAREMTTEGPCFTQVWHTLLKDFLDEPTYSRFMSYWISEEIRPLYYNKFLAGHLGATSPFINIGSPSTVPSHHLKDPAQPWPTTSQTYAIPAVSEELYSTVLNRLQNLLREHQSRATSLISARPTLLVSPK
jgi:hypothetical protein